MSVTNLVCNSCGAKATRAQLVDGTHISKTLCDLNKEVYDLRTQVIFTEILRERLGDDVQDLVSDGLEENVVPDKEWLRYARRYFKSKMNALNNQVSDLQKLKEAMILHNVGHVMPVADQQETTEARNLKLIS